jgi:UDP-N-acetylglucosamine acyltransferase
MTDLDVGALARRHFRQLGFVLVDRVEECDPRGRLRAIKVVSGSEDFFQGHFPGAPVMPGVLVMESLAQAAGIWLLRTSAQPDDLVIQVVGFDRAKFRKPVVPGDRLELDVELRQRRGSLCRFTGNVRAAGDRVAEVDLWLHASPDGIAVHPTARISPGAELSPGVRVGPYSIVGPGVTVGPGTVIESHVVLLGPTRLGAGNHLFAFSSVGLEPQDKKYRGEPSRLVVGDRNTFREFVTIHRGTKVGGNETTIGSDNLFMAYAHVAHDCRIGDHTVLANNATLAGHVEVGDWATIGGFSGVHQFCRVGRHAILGGSSVATKDVLPFSTTVGNRACIYGVNKIGLRRQGFTEERVLAIKKAYRVLIQSRLNTSDAVARIEQAGGESTDVHELVEFIRSSPRGVILKRRHASAIDAESPAVVDG